MTTFEVTCIIVGGAIAAVAGFVVFLPWLIRPLIRVVLALRYGIRVKGLENIPRRGPAVLVSNHVTWIDGLFLCAACPRRGRILANAGFFTNPVLNFLARRAGIIPVPFTGPKAQRAAIAAARLAIARGEAFAIMPEGQLTRTGFLGPFYRGLEVILKGQDAVPVVPAWLDGLWGSILSFEGGKTLHRWPRGLRRSVRIAFGPPLTGPPGLFEIRLAIQEAGVDAIEMGRDGPVRLETIDPSLPTLDHPELGLLTASAPDYDHGGVTQPGQRPGTAGLPLPGVALRVLDESGQPVAEDVRGRVHARVAGREGWTDTGRLGRLDKDGFLILT